MSWVINKITITTDAENIPIVRSSSGNYFRVFFFHRLLSKPVDFTIINGNSSKADTNITIQCAQGDASEVVAAIFVATPNAVGEQVLVCQGWCLFNWHEIISCNGTLFKESTYLYDDTIPYTLSIEGVAHGSKLPALVDVRAYEKTESEYLRQWNEDTSGYTPFHSTLLTAKFPYYKESTITMPGYMYGLLCADNPFDSSVLEPYVRIAVDMTSGIEWDNLKSLRDCLTIAFKTCQIYVTSCAYTQDVARIKDSAKLPHFSNLYVSWQRSPHILLRMAEAMNSITYDHSGDCEEFARATCYCWNAIRTYSGSVPQLLAIKKAASNYREYLALSAFTEVIQGSHMTCIFLRNDLVPGLNMPADKSLEKFVWIDSVNLIPIHNGGNHFDNYDSKRSIIVSKIEDIFSRLVKDNRKFQPSRKLTHWLHTEVTSILPEYQKICITRLFPTTFHNADRMLLPVKQSPKKFGVMVTDPEAFDVCIPIQRNADHERDQILQKFHLAPRVLQATGYRKNVLWEIRVRDESASALTNVMISPYFFNKLDLKVSLEKEKERLGVCRVVAIKYEIHSTMAIPPVFLLQFYFN